LTNKKTKSEFAENRAENDTNHIYNIHLQDICYKKKKLKNNFWTPMPIYINEIAQRTIIKKILIILVETTTKHKKEGCGFKKTNGEFLPKQTRIVFVNK